MFFNWCCVLNFDEFEEILKGFVLFLELLFKFFVLLLETGELEGMGAVGDVEGLNGVFAAVGGGFTAFLGNRGVGNVGDLLLFYGMFGLISNRVRVRGLVLFGCFVTSCFLLLRYVLLSLEFWEQWDVFLRIALQPLLAVILRFVTLFFSLPNFSFTPHSSSYHTSTLPLSLFLSFLYYSTTLFNPALYELLVFPDLLLLFQEFLLLSHLFVLFLELFLEHLLGNVIFPLLVFLTNFVDFCESLFSE